MKKEFLDLMYATRATLLARLEKLNARDIFDGSEGSCDETIHRMQVAEVAHQLETHDKQIGDYLRIHAIP